MAPVLQLSDISLTFGGEPLFDGLSLVVPESARMALVGRNGSGKSTLLKIMAGLVEVDRGARVVPPGTTVAYMEQDPDFSGFETLGDFAIHGLEPQELYKVERAGEGLGFDPDRKAATASGGERRRAALARLLAEDPALMLLDEPTNHLDITAITWLETMLKESRSAQIIISHDRRFLNALARSVLWVDRGQVRTLDRSFQHFEDWRDRTWAEEDLTRHKLDRKIKSEARWAVEGISARRKRNQGRVRALRDLRKERAAMIRREGTAAMALADAPRSGKKVIEAKNVAKSFGDIRIVRDFSLTVQRGDCVALVGPNGVGKTTLLRMLTGEIAPDVGQIKLGTTLDIAVFDQTRAQLDPEMTLWDSLTVEKDMRVGGRSDQVMVRGAPRHVVGYLKDFLFDERQARAPVRSLSGGEKARLLLARIMAKPANLLVLDEPTNDLDVETLDLLQDLIGGFEGTVLLVSHDRDFLDRVATTTIVLDGDGRATICAGGWSDAEAQRGKSNSREAPEKPEKTSASRKERPTQKKSGLSFTEEHRLKELPGLIDRLGAEIAKLETLMADPELFTREPVKFQKATEALVTRQSALAEAEEEWLELAEKAETAGHG